MHYAEWKREYEHHDNALDKLRTRLVYRVTDEVDAIVYLLSYEPGFTLQLHHLSTGTYVELAKLEHVDFIHLTNLHEALTRYVQNDNPLAQETDLPDPKIWNRPDVEPDRSKQRFADHTIE